jgi:preprotein translocase subunit SecF
MIDWMKYRLMYLIISTLVIGAGVFSLFKWGLNLGVDFKGGAIIEYRLAKSYSTEELTQGIEKTGIAVTSIQQTEGSNYIFRFPPIEQAQKEQIKQGLEKITNNSVTELRFENVGPSIGPDLVKKTIIALIISASSILLWVAYQFKNLKFGVTAIIGMFHDSLVLIGSFSLLGHFFGAEIDFLFVTALLTILSFSVHDTIVNYDRIRESQKKVGGDLKFLANKATSETMVRSLNNSFTIIFMLMALVLLGGTTVKWFAIALLVGTVSGTYSSPFVSVSLLVTWDEIEKKLKRR